MRFLRFDVQKNTKRLLKIKNISFCVFGLMHMSRTFKKKDLKKKNSKIGARVKP